MIMEDIIAVAVGLVVGGGILTLVWRILRGDKDERALDEALSKFVPDDAAANKGAKAKGGKGKAKADG
jgi:uncharacterized membrane protein YccC